MGPEQSYSRLRFPGPPASISPTGRPLEELSRLWCSERWAPKRGDRDTLRRVAGHSSGWSGPRTGRVGPPASPQTGREHRTCSGNTEGLSLQTNLKGFEGHRGKVKLGSCQDISRCSWLRMGNAPWNQLGTAAEFLLESEWGKNLNWHIADWFRKPRGMTPPSSPLWLRRKSRSVLLPRGLAEKVAAVRRAGSELSSGCSPHRVRGLWWTRLLSPRITVRRWEGKGGWMSFQWSPRAAAPFPQQARRASVQPLPDLSTRNTGPQVLGLSQSPRNLPGLPALHPTSSTVTGGSSTVNFRCLPSYRE